VQKLMALVLRMCWKQMGWKTRTAVALQREQQLVILRYGQSFCFCGINNEVIERGQHQNGEKKLKV